MRLGTKGPWGLAFDGFERRNPQKSDSAVQKQALEKYLTTEPFYSEPQVLAWMREHIPYLPKKDSDRAYSGYIDYSDPAADSTLRDLDRLVTISDATAAYRDYALSGVDVRYVGANPPTPAQIWAYEPDLQVVDLESLTLDGHRFAPSAKLIGTTFENCSLVGVSFEGCDLDQANFLECNLTRANFTGATLTGVAFDDCTLGNAIFDQADLTEVTFANDSFSRGVGLRGASFKDTSFNDVNFETAKFVEEALYLDNLPPNALVRF